MALRSGGERGRAPRRASRFGIGVLALIVSGCAAGASRSGGGPAAGAREAPQLAAAVHFREYKLPLRADRMVDPAAGAEQFWQVAAREAERQGARVEKAQKRPKPARAELVLLDTPDERFFRSGLVLRRRGRDHVPGGTATYELTLTSQSPDIRTAHAAPIQASGVNPSTLRFEEEVLVDPGHPGGGRSVWSLESTVRKPDRSRDLTLGDVSEVFPATAGRLGPSATPLAPVGGLRIEQIEVELGELVFGETRVAPVVLVWRDRSSGSVIASEYNFTEKIPDYWAQPKADALAVRAYFTSLQSAARDWLGPSASNAEALYARAGARS